MKNKSKAKKSAVRAGTKKRPTHALSWHEQGEALARALTKSSSKSGVLVMSRSGETVFRAGSSTGYDETSVGALATAVREAQRQLDSLMGCKTNPAVQMGDKPALYWIEQVQDWIVIGVRIPRSGSLLSKFYKHLRKKPANSASISGQGSEALSGLTDAGLDAALGTSGR